jgi:HAD superfamily hydrolase (TIGR01509 family)
MSILGRLKKRVIKKGKFKAILFDMDGVIINSSEPWRIAFNDTLRKFGSKPVTKKVYFSRYGDIGTVKEVIKKFRIDFKNPRFKDDAVKYCNQRFDELSKGVKIFPESRKALMILKKKFKIALVTNTERQTVFKILKRFDIERYFDVVVSISDVSNGKPDPEMVIKACKVLRTKPSHAVLVGDTEADMKTGEAAGCKVIGVGINGDDMVENIGELPKKMGLKA